MKGHIRQVGEGRWQVLFDISPDPVTGRRRQRARTIRGTREAAEDALAELVAEVDAGGFVDDGSLTVSALIEMWLEVRRPQVAATTLDGYRQKLAHLDRHVGHRKVRALTGGILSALYSRLMSEHGLSGQSALHVHRVAHKMLADAARWGYIRSNPADAADPPRSDTDERPVWDAETAKGMLRAVSDHRWRVAWWLALGAGMRRSEIAGLKWGRVDLEDRSLQVRETLVVVGGHDAWKPTPKSSSSRRTVALDRGVVAVLTAERRRQLELRMADPAAWRSEDTVICWDDGRRVHPDRLTHAHVRIVRRLGLDPYVAFHDLRHTHATLARAAGVDANVVKERLGHSSVLITLDRYSHRVDDLHREAAETVGRMLAT